MSLLGDLGGGSLSGANCPHGFVSHDHVRPVLDLLTDGVELAFVDGLGVLCLSLGQGFADAGQNGKSVIQSPLGLKAYFLVGLVVERPALRMSGEGVVDPQLGEHFQGDLSGEGSIAGKGHILSADIHSAAGVSLHVLEVEVSGAHEDLDLVGVELQLVQNFSGESVGELEAAIALPVATYKVPSHLLWLI
eukprot:CAMPEP_0170494316 /NCGR_PEP_ID=MMETSP0208-20121228/14573_1 /TAXON_ID=197538 /ORGANISM="Strombidium inclinatum, Strain S3" /LENGTH=190 /DNA_ID=CAMNT_0010770357 /DNA_START=269 /DNA_END=838 /DNA_ORIENTATION=-